MTGDIMKKTKLLICREHPSTFVRHKKQILLPTKPELVLNIYSTHSVKVLHYIFRVLVVVFTPVNFWTLVGKNSCRLFTRVDSWDRRRQTKQGVISSAHLHCYRQLHHSLPCRVFLLFVHGNKYLHVYANLVYHISWKPSSHLNVTLSGFLVNNWTHS